MKTLTVILAGFLAANPVVANKIPSLTILAGSTQTAATSTSFDSFGELVQGVECVLFRADTGELYVLENRGGYHVGDHVWVRGVLNPNCATICMQGNGCIENNIIIRWPTPDLNMDGYVEMTDLAIFADRWLQTGCDEPEYCSGADLNRDGRVALNDLAVVADSWLLREEGGNNQSSMSKYYAAYENPTEPNAAGYTLPLDVAQVTNYALMDYIFGLDGAAALLRENGFAIIDDHWEQFGERHDDIVWPYKYLSAKGVSLFVTSDTLLHLYHIQFDETLKEIEEREFYRDINDLTAVLLTDALAQYDQFTGDLRESARRNVAYLSVAQKLLSPDAQVPAMIAGLVAGELAKIEAHQGFAASDIFIYQEDYSQYVPRGHYTRSEELKRYFKALMWYGRMAFLLKGSENWGPMGEALINVYDAKIQTLQAVLLAESIEKVTVGEHTGRHVWDRIYAVTTFYVGLADDLTPCEYVAALDKVFGSNFTPTDLEIQENFLSLKTELGLLRSPKIFGGTGNAMVTPPITSESLDEILDKTKGMRFMGQRFIPDSYMFQQLVFPEVLNYTGDMDPVPFTLGIFGRCFPRGLDVMALLGSNRAKAILVEEGDTDYINYWQQFNKLKGEVDSFAVSDWNRNLYWGWLYSLRALIDEFGKGYPAFMRTEAWEKKELNASLASWAELRHDTILYAKQSYTPGKGGTPTLPGYVEPVPEFYGRLLALTQMTRQGLKDMSALSAEAESRLLSLENILAQLLVIANKELTNQSLSNSEWYFIKTIGEQLEKAVIGVSETGVKTTLVADVHTHSAEGKVLEEGVGHVDLIIVACPNPDGSVFLTAGPVLSYYEFKHPMNDRLTDEAWRTLLGTSQKPDRPNWFKPLVR